MKKMYFTFLFYFFGIFLFVNAQTDIEYIISEEDYSEMRVMAQTDEVTFVGGSVNYLGQAKAAIYAINHQGEKLWEIILGDLSTVKDMYYRESDQTLIVSVLWAYAIDVGTDMDGPRVYGIDLNGDILFETIFTRADFDYSFGVNNITSLSNDEIVLSSRDWIFWMDPMGILIDTLLIPASGYKDFIALNDSIFMALGFSGEIEFLNKDGVTSTIFGNYVFERALLDASRVLILTETDILIYDIANGTLSPTNTTTNIISEREIAMDENFVYVSGKTDQSEIPIIERYNKSDLTYVDFISVEQPCRVHDLISNGTDLFFIGQQSFTESIETYLNAQLQESFLKSSPVFETPIYQGTNISISNPNIILPAEIAYFDSTELINVYTEPYALFEYDVTNLSSDTIYSFTTASQTYGYNLFAVGRLFTHTKNVIIPPGETYTVLDSLRTLLTQYDEVLKIIVFAPNHQFDLDQSDNTLFIDDILPIAICDCSSEFQFSIYPNPASEQLNIFLQNENASIAGKIQLVNLNGQVLRENIVMPQMSHYSFSVKALPKGIYFLQYQKEGLTIKTEKVLIH